MNLEQGGSLPFYTSERQLSLSEALTRPRAQFSWDWYRQPLLGGTRFAAALDPDYFFFVLDCDLPAACNRSLALGGFAPLLWQQDVAEFFIKTAGSSNYWELNLSPSGAWWLAEFEDYRQPRQDCDYSGAAVQAHSRETPASWEAAIALPRSLIPPLAGENSAARFNVTAIIGGERRQFLSWAELPSEKPDFHRVEGFVPAEWTLL